MIIIEVQHCIGCQTHNWCSHHNEAKYHQFYKKLESKVCNQLGNVKITRNHPPPSYVSTNANSSLTLGGNRYIDEHNQTVNFPRHGAFQIRVNGVLIFSKLQSNLWPNLDKIGQILGQIAADIQKGRDIKKFSIEQTIEPIKEDQKTNEASKKLIKFKIKNRPHSSQFNATSYIPKPLLQPSVPFGLKKKNGISLTKLQGKQRKSEFDKKALLRMRERKQEQANTYYNQYQDFKDIALEDDIPQTLPLSKASKNEISPVSKKKIQFKNEVLLPVRNPFEVRNKQQNIKLQKKQSRKLILKTSDKKPIQDKDSEKKNVRIPILQVQDHISADIQNKGKQLDDQIKVKDYETQKTIKTSKYQQPERKQQVQMSIKQSPKEREIQTNYQFTRFTQTDHQQEIQKLEQALEKPIQLQQQLPSPQIQLEKSVQNVQDTIENLIQPEEIYIQRKNALPDYQESDKAPSIKDEEQPDHISDLQENVFQPQAINSQRIDYQEKHEEEILEYQQIIEENFINKNTDIKEQFQMDSIVNELLPDKDQQYQECVINETKQYIQRTQDLLVKEVSGQDIQEVELRSSINQPQQFDEKNDDQKIENNVLIQGEYEGVHLPDQYLVKPPSAQEEVNKGGQSSEHNIFIPQQKPEQDNENAHFAQVSQTMHQNLGFTLPENSTQMVEQPPQNEEQKSMIRLPALLETITSKEQKVPLSQDVQASLHKDDRRRSIGQINIQKESNHQILQQEQEAQKVQKNPLPASSINNIPQEGQATIKSIPDATQSSIALTCQVHSQLNYIYDDIEAKIQEKLAADQEQP